MFHDQLRNSIVSKVTCVKHEKQAGRTLRIWLGWEFEDKASRLCQTRFSRKRKVHQLQLLLLTVKLNASTITRICRGQNQTSQSHRVPLQTDQSKTQISRGQLLLAHIVKVGMSVLVYVRQTICEYHAESLTLSFLLQFCQ